MSERKKTQLKDGLDDKSILEALETERRELKYQHDNVNLMASFNEEQRTDLVKRLEKLSFMLGPTKEGGDAAYKEAKQRAAARPTAEPAEELPECPICFDEIEAEDIEVAHPPSNAGEPPHKFHKNCLDQMKQHDRAEGVMSTCPICREPLTAAGRKDKALAAIRDRVAARRQERHRLAAAPAGEPLPAPAEELDADGVTARNARILAEAGRRARENFATRQRDAATRQRDAARDAAAQAGEPLPSAEASVVPPTVAMIEDSHDLQHQLELARRELRQHRAEREQVERRLSAQPPPTSAEIAVMDEQMRRQTRDNRQSDGGIYGRGF